MRYHEFNQLKMTAQQHFFRGACCHADLDIDAARKAEGITFAKERTTNGRWFWTLAPEVGDHGEDGTPPNP